PDDEVDERGGAHVEAVEGEVVVGVGARVGEVDERAARQVVDHVDRVPLGEEAIDERRPDEAGASGDERPHRGAPASTLTPSSSASAATAARPATTDPPRSRARSPTTASSPTTDRAHLGRRRYARLAGAYFRRPGSRSPVPSC